MRALCFALGLMSSLVSFEANASPGDEENPAVDACAGKKAGDACMRTVATKPADGPLEQKRVPGVCAEDKCCELDYSKGSPPQTVCGPCLACKEGPGDTPPTGDTAPTSEGKSGDDASGDAKTTVAGEGGPPADDGAPPANDTGKKGCAIAGSAPTSGTALLFMLAFVRRRRG